MSLPSETREVEKTNRTMIVVIGIMVTLAIAAAVYFVARGPAPGADTAATQAAAVDSAARLGATAQSAADQSAINAADSQATAAQDAAQAATDRAAIAAAGANAPARSDAPTN